jgi:AAA domain
MNAPRDHAGTAQRESGWYDDDEQVSDSGDRPESFGANGHAGANQGEHKSPLIQSSSEFTASFVPPEYLVDGLLQAGFLYSLTGATGAGKTAITLRLAASTALGMVFAGRETTKRRVLYLAGENPVDVRMRWIALGQQMDFDTDTIEVFFIEGVFRISEMTERLQQEASERGGDFGLVVVDTGPAFYEGDDENNRVQQGEHADLLRALTRIIPGNPTVIANCHPVKNAAADNLIPAGGGNFLNKVDGNLTAAKTDSTIEIHWQGKFRGVEFGPIHFMLRTVTHERLKTSKGRLMPTVVCEWLTEAAKETITKQAISDEDQMLKLINAEPQASYSSLAAKMGWKLHNEEPNKMRAKRCVAALIGAKLVTKVRIGHELTRAGKEALKGGEEW